MSPPPGILATALQSSPMELCISFITRVRIYIGEKEPKDMRIYKFVYDTLFIQMFTVISSNGDFNVLMSTGNDMRHLL